MTDQEKPAGIRVPLDRLSEDALRGVIEEYVSREGTDYGHADVDLEAKVRAVRRQLDDGEVVVLFDPATETINIVPTRDLG